MFENTFKKYVIYDPKEYLSQLLSLPGEKKNIQNVLLCKIKKKINQFSLK